MKLFSSSGFKLYWDWSFALRYGDRLRVHLDVNGVDLGPPRSLKDVAVFFRDDLHVRVNLFLGFSPDTIPSTSLEKYGQGGSHVGIPEIRREVASE